jgi:thymidylate kinase
MHFRKSTRWHAVPLLVEPPAAPPARTLQVVAGLLRALDDADVRYCHWKSNEHLTAALQGLTDLDVLVDRASVRITTRLLAGQGFRRFATAPAAAYPGVEDHLAVDPFTGRLVHLHLHWQLTLGEPYLKGYRLPWEERMLAGRRLDHDGEVYVADPHVELLLLLVRAALKLRTRDRLGSLAGHAYVSGDLLREHRWLQTRVDPARLREVAAELVGPVAAERVHALADRDPTTNDLRALRREVEPPLERCRTFAPSEAALRRWWREGRSLMGRALRRYARGWSSPSPWRRTVPQGGMIVAVLGADGSGKSTLARELGRWLGRKVDVLELYLGSGNGAISLTRRILRMVPAIASRRRPASHARAGVQPAQTVVDLELGRVSLVPSLKALWFAAWALAIARERTVRLRAARRARNLGMIVVCDRFPQSQVPGFNDGRLLTPWLSHRSPVLRAAARREAAAFEAFAQCPPDLVLKLDPGVEIAAARRPETSRAWLERKVRLVHELAFGEQTRVVVIDSSRPQVEVQRDAKLTLWESL